MSILIRLKNRFQDPSLYETKIREFDECMSYLKNENVELHKRVDELEALCKTSITTTTPQTHSLQEYIRQLEQENGRLVTENQFQRQEYERFLDQLTKMVIRTAVMQENIRQECATIYHVIERLTTNAIHINQPFELIIKTQKKSLSCEVINRLSSSSSSLTTNGSISSSNSWTLDLVNAKTQLPISDKEEKSLQRSETFTISKIPQEDLSTTVKDHPIPQTMIKPTSSTTVRPSRLPARCSNSKPQPSNNNRSLSAQKVSKLPIRTSTSLNRPQTLLKKSYIPTPIGTKKDTTIASNRSIPSVNNTSIRKIIQPPLNKSTIEIVKSNDPIEHMNSTSSESSIEEQQQMNKLLPIPQDEGYSTWSSIDVKDDVIEKKNGTDDRLKNIGLVKTWLDTTNRQYANKPVTEVENAKLEQFTQELLDNPSFLCPFVRNRCSNGEPISLTSTTLTSLNKDISLDSLDSSQSEEQTITSSSSSSSSTSSSSTTFSRSEIFENVLIAQTLTNLTDSTSSTSSTFNMSEYIEDHFMEQDDNNNSSSSSSNSDDDLSSFETTIINRTNLLKPQKRLLFPGLLNRLVFFRRILSESDLQRKKFYINENENQSNVYHSNIINEHSVEVNLINTYGSDTELHVWSHDCAEQRRFLNERQQQQSSNQIKQNSNQQLALERQILLQQIYEYPWLLQENDLDQTSTDLIVPSHNPDFYQLCTLTNSSSFVISYDSNSRQTKPSITTSTAL